MKKILLFSCMMVFFSSNVLAASTTKAPAGTQSQAVVPQQQVVTNGKNIGNFGSPAATALLIKDVNPWNTTQNEVVLTANGINYDLATCAQAGKIPLAKYKFIVVASDQPQACYDVLAPTMAPFGKIETYVRRGGVLMFNGADRGWQNGVWKFQLPGGAVHVTRYKATNKVLSPGHPIAAGMPPSWTGNWASHGYFTRYPANAKRITAESPWPHVTTIEYCYNKGRVLSSTTTLEWGVPHAQAQGALHNNMIPYANRVGPCVLPAVDGCVSLNGKPARFKRVTLKQGQVAKATTRTDMQGCFSIPRRKLAPGAANLDIKIQ